MSGWLIKEEWVEREAMTPEIQTRHQASMIEVLRGCVVCEHYAPRKESQLLKPLDSDRQHGADHS